MDKQQQIREGLIRLTDPGTCTLLGLVQSVNEDEKTIVLKDDQTGVLFDDVRLRPVVNGDDFITIFPKVGTWCLAVRIEDEQEWMVLQVQEADKYTIKIGTCELVMTADGFEIKKGGDNLKDVISLVIQAVMQIVVMMGNNPDYVKLNQAATKLNNLFS